MSEVDGAIAVLANDPDFQRKVAEQMAAGKAAQQFRSVIAELIRGFAASRRGELLPSVSDDAMQAAAEFFARVQEHNEAGASDDDVEEMVRSWSA
ncbi:MAG: hypothetical protein J0L92_21585 [Deltaproteobacteria bacterium]|nr:hypothetical protein [Deltaproteobacteria bacterium]